ncbi:hypothetical protein V5799_020928 [Amblyomma americanum]|uniref:Uncharacterized protein n=1 Tax=Amblyomma americanum TaxID=6943 RepID=A0AAQ4ESQ1_AMBAM
MRVHSGSIQERQSCAKHTRESLRHKPKLPYFNEASVPVFTASKKLQCDDLQIYTGLHYNSFKDVFGEIQHKPRDGEEPATTKSPMRWCTSIGQVILGSYGS